MFGYSWIFYARCFHFGTRVPINEHTPKCVKPIGVVNFEDAYCLPCLRSFREMERVMMLASLAL
jgi:hypothetical protein